MAVKKKDVAIEVPDKAHQVPKGFPVQILYAAGNTLMFCVFAPMMPSPRPRVTTRGTFMPTEYRKYCDAMGASMAYARGYYESYTKDGMFIDMDTGELKPIPEDRMSWDSSTPFKLRVHFYGAKKRGDLDNLCKTIMDAGQLHRGEPPGAELWMNDSQICGLEAEYVACEAKHAALEIMVRRPDAIREKSRAI